MFESLLMVETTAASAFGGELDLGDDRLVAAMPERRVFLHDVISATPFDPRKARRILLVVRG